VGLIFLCVLAAAGAGAFKAGWLGDPWANFEKTTLNPGFRSSATTGDLGLSFQRVTIQSVPRTLDGFLVSAPPGCGRSVAVLIFHGRGETIADWGKAQLRFHDSCITSLVFDYSGHGRSTGPGSIANLNADAVEAYKAFIAFTPKSRHCLFSHSMGGGPMLWAATSGVATPDCIVIASPFSSLVSMAERGGLPALIGALMPDVWDNAAQVARIHAPLMWIHSRSDQTIPVAEGQAVFDAAPNPKTALTLDGYGHNAIYKELPNSIWAPMTVFIRGEPMSRASSSPRASP
jgi:pimeloyl-ACP methyl ester carboxylesterase